MWPAGTNTPRTSLRTWPRFPPAIAPLEDRESGLRTPRDTVCTTRGLVAFPSLGAAASGRRVSELAKRAPGIRALGSGAQEHSAIPLDCEDRLARG